MTCDEMTAAWLEFKKGWYQDDDTQFWYRDFDNGWRICVVSDKKTGEWAHSVMNWNTRTRHAAGPFSTRATCARNAFAQIMLWLDRVSPEVAQDWLQRMKETDVATKEI